MDEERRLRESLAELGARLDARGHNGPLDGNLSARLGDDRVLTTPTGRPKGALRPSEIVLVDLASGQPVDGQRASTELRLHLAVYMARPDIRAIVHAHSPNVVALSLAGRGLDPPAIPEAVATLGLVPTVPYRTPTTSDVAQLAAEYAREADVFVLERHGPVALGRTLEEARIRLETLEHVARITVAALSLGPVAPLPEAEVARLLEMSGRRPKASRD